MTQNLEGRCLTVQKLKCARIPEYKLAMTAKTRQSESMSMTIEQIVKETNQWSPDQLERLFEHLLASHYREPDPAVEAAWKDEAARRVAQMESGEEPGVPGDEVMAKVRRIVGL